MPRKTSYHIESIKYEASLVILAYYLVALPILIIAISMISTGRFGAVESVVLSFFIAGLPVLMVFQNPLHIFLVLLIPLAFFCTSRIRKEKLRFWLYCAIVVLWSLYGGLCLMHIPA